MRRSLAQSTASEHALAEVVGQLARELVELEEARTRPAAAPCRSRYIDASLPSARRPSVVASIEPSASPSGFSCVTTRKRSFAADRRDDRGLVSAHRPVPPRSAPAGRRVTSSISFVMRTAALDGLDRRQNVSVRRPLQAELAVDPRLQHAVRGLEPGQRRAPLLLVAEHRDVDGRLAQVGRDVDAGDRDHADPRVLQLADALGDDGPHRLVDPAHALAHGRQPRPSTAHSSSSLTIRRSQAHELPLRAAS